MKETKKTITLFDVGGLIIIVALFGLPLGVMFDYVWNLVVFSAAAPLLPGERKVSISTRRKLAYIFFVTLLGIIIDWAYLEMTWDIHIGKGGIWVPAMSQGLQFAWLLLPAVMIGLGVFALAYAFLKMDRQRSIILGGAMAVFTAPWLLPTIPYWMGWTV